MWFNIERDVYLSIDTYTYTYSQKGSWEWPRIGYKMLMFNRQGCSVLGCRVNKLRATHSYNRAQVKSMRLSVTLGGGLG